MELSPGVWRTPAGIISRSERQTATTLDAVRTRLKRRAGRLELLAPDPLLVGPGRTRARLERTRAEHQLRALELRAIADLPDPDLRWLLIMGWDPELHQ